MKQHPKLTMIPTVQDATLFDHLSDESQKIANLRLLELYYDLVERICWTVQRAHNVVKDLLIWGNHMLSVIYVLSVW